MIHSFNTHVAMLVGPNAAVILNHLYFWVEKNAADNRHFHEGRYWTYASRSALQKLFPYLSDKQIRGAIDKLEKEGLITTGHFSKSVYNRTKWYSVTKRGYHVLNEEEPDAPEKSTIGNVAADQNGRTVNTFRAELSALEGQTITDIYNTDINNNTDINTLIREEKPKGKSDKIPYQEIVDQYNAICISLPKVTRLNKQRKGEIKARYTEYSRNEIIDVFRKAQASDFLTGRSGTWNATFDWLMKPSNFLKVAEGNYANPIRAVNSEPNELQDFYERVARWASKKEEEDEDE